MQPRANLRKLFKDGDIHPDDKQGIEEFSAQFFMDIHLVTTYLHRLQSLRNARTIRPNERKKVK